MPEQVLLIATSSRHKLGEISAFLARLPYRIVGLDSFPPVDAPEENGSTFEENALIKARAYSAAFNVPCVADDSGLVVDALGGRPGIFSARYAGPNADDAANNAKLLAELDGVPDPQRTARFVCCCVYLAPDDVPHIEIGTVEGRIAHAVSGSHGFGYDPLFVPDGYEQTFGELDPTIKAAVSHRSKAFRKLRAHLEQLTP